MSRFVRELRGDLEAALERYDRAPAWRRAVRAARAGRPSLGAAAAAVAVAAALVFVVAAAVSIPQEAARPVRGFTVQGGATSLARSGHALWVVDQHGVRLVQFDARTGTPRARVPVPELPGAAVSAGGAGVWLVGWSRGTVVRVDPRARRISARAQICPFGEDVAVGHDAVWAIGHCGDLFRIDAVRGVVTRRLPLGLAAAAADRSSRLALAGSTLWVVGHDGRVIRVDARSARVVARLRGPAPGAAPPQAAADASGLWLSDPRGRRLLHVGARTSRIDAQIPLGGAPGAVAVSGGRVWVATAHGTRPSARVTVVDPTTRRVVRTVPLAAPAGPMIADGSGGIWAALPDTARPNVVRLRP